MRKARTLQTGVISPEKSQQGSACKTTGAAREKGRRRACSGGIRAGRGRQRRGGGGRDEESVGEGKPSLDVEMPQVRCATRALLVLLIAAPLVRATTSSPPSSTTTTTIICHCLSRHPLHLTTAIICSTSNCLLRRRLIPYFPHNVKGCSCVVPRSRRRCIIICMLRRGCMLSNV